MKIVKLNEMISTKMEASVFIASMYPKMTTISEFESLVCDIHEKTPEGIKIIHTVEEIGLSESGKTELLQHCISLIFQGEQYS